MTLTKFSFVVYSLLGIASCLAMPKAELLESRDASPNTTLGLIPRVIWQPKTPDMAWCECITQRANGDLLVTRFDSGQVWTINPYTDFVQLVHQFEPSTGINSSLGIGEYKDDIFAFNAGQTSGGLPVSGTWNVFSLDMRQWDTRKIANVELITPIPAAGLLNGLTVFNPAITHGPRAKGLRAKSTVFTADSINGQVFLVDLTTKKVSVYYSNRQLLTAPPGAEENIGLNGLEFPPVLDPTYLYATTGFRGTFYRFKLTPGNELQAPASGPELLLEGYTNLDDFALDAYGNAYMATVGDNKIVKRWANGTVEGLISGGQMKSPTAVLLSSRYGKPVLYMNNGYWQDASGAYHPGKTLEVFL